MNAEANASLRGWLTERIAAHTDHDPAAIDATVPLADYGLESVGAVSLCGDIEERLGLVVEETVVWDYPTVAQLADYLEARTRA